MTRSHPDRPHRPPLHPDDDLVERLVQIADRGPDIPADGPGAVKAAIRPEWQRLVARRRRRLAWSTGLAAAATVLVGLILGLRMTTVTPPPTLATVIRVEGTAIALAADGGATTLAGGHLGVPLAAGTVIRTDTATRVALDLAGGQSLRLDHSTAVRLTDPGVIELETGAVYVDSGPEAGDGLAILTALGRLTDIGTQFEVRSADGGLLIRVREGAVRLDGGAEPLQVPAGFEADVTAGGEVGTRVIAPHDPIFAWAVELAPPILIEGRSVMQLLDWVSRETGLWIRYVDPATEALALETVLHGSAEGLTPLEAATTILPGCGLRAELEGNALIVRPLGGPATG